MDVFCSLAPSSCSARSHASAATTAIYLRRHGADAAIDFLLAPESGVPDVRSQASSRHGHDAAELGDRAALPQTIRDRGLRRPCHRTATAAGLATEVALVWLMSGDYTVVHLTAKGRVLADEPLYRPARPRPRLLRVSDGRELSTLRGRALTSRQAFATGLPVVVPSVPCRICSASRSLGRKQVEFGSF